MSQKIHEEITDGPTIATRTGVIIAQTRRTTLTTEDEDNTATTDYTPTRWGAAKTQQPPTGGRAPGD